MNSTNAINRLAKAGVTRTQIANRLGCTRAAVSHWATGRSIPGGPRLKALIEIASERGIVLMADDFGTPAKREVA